MAYISATSINDTSIGCLVFVDSAPASNYYIYITCDQTGERSPDLGYGSGNSSNSYLFTGLQSGTTYSFTGEVRPVGGSTSYIYRSFTTTGSSAPSASSAYLSAYNIAHNFIEVGVLGLSAPAYNYYIYITCQQTGETSGDLGQGSSTNSYTHTFTGLQPNTLYTFNASIRNSNNEYWYPDRSFITSAPPRPQNFSWNVSVVQGQSFNMTASEWNRFLTRINEFRTYKSYNNASFNYAIQGATAYASQYNEARNAIAVLSASVPPVRSSTNNILASDVNQLVTALNSTV